MTITALEYSHIDWAGRKRIDNYIPVDSIETGVYLAKEALKEEQRPNTKVEHPSDYQISQPLCREAGIYDVRNTTGGVNDG